MADPRYALILSQKVKGQGHRIIKVKLRAYVDHRRPSLYDDTTA